MNLNAIIAAARNAAISVAFKRFAPALLPFANVRGCLAASPKVAFIGTPVFRHACGLTGRATVAAWRCRFLKEFRRAVRANTLFLSPVVSPTSREIAGGAAELRVLPFCSLGRNVKQISAFLAHTICAGFLAARNAYGPFVPRVVAFVERHPRIIQSYFDQAVRNLEAATKEAAQDLFAEAA